MNSFPCRIIGGPKYITTYQDKPHILNLQGPTLYPVALVKARVKLYEGAPVYNNHPSTRWHQPIGVVTYAAWSDIGQCIIGMFQANNQATKERLFEIYVNGQTEAQGVSAVYNIKPELLTFDGPEVWKLAKDILSISSVDLVDEAMAGGQLLDPDKWLRLSEARPKVANVPISRVVDRFNVVNFNKPTGRKMECIK